jgi:hypothetical protein
MPLIDTSKVTKYCEITKTRSAVMCVSLCLSQMDEAKLKNKQKNTIELKSDTKLM